MLVFTGLLNNAACHGRQVAAEPEMAMLLSGFIYSSEGQEIYLRRPSHYNLPDKCLSFAEVGPGFTHSYGGSLLGGPTERAGLSVPRWGDGGPTGSTEYHKQIVDFQHLQCILHMGFTMPSTSWGHCMRTLHPTGAAADFGRGQASGLVCWAQLGAVVEHTICPWSSGSELSDAAAKVAELLRFHCELAIGFITQVSEPLVP